MTAPLRCNSAAPLPNQTPRAWQRAVSIAIHTTGHMNRVYSSEGWTYNDPHLPPQDQWITDRDAFIRHALGLIGR